MFGFGDSDAEKSDKQFELNRRSLNQVIGANQVNQHTPFGSSLYTGEIGSSYRTHTVSLNPADQQQLDSRRQASSQIFSALLSGAPGQTGGKPMGGGEQMPAPGGDPTMGGTAPGKGGGQGGAMPQPDWSPTQGGGMPPPGGGIEMGGDGGMDGGMVSARAPGGQIMPGDPRFPMLPQGPRMGGGPR